MISHGDKEKKKKIKKKIKSLKSHFTIKLAIQSYFNFSFFKVNPQFFFIIVLSHNWTLAYDILNAKVSKIFLIRSVVTTM